MSGWDDESARDICTGRAGHSRNFALTRRLDAFDGGPAANTTLGKRRPTGTERRKSSKQYRKGCSRGVRVVKRYWSSLYPTLYCIMSVIHLRLDSQKTSLLLVQDTGLAKLRDEFVDRLDLLGIVRST